MLCRKTKKEYRNAYIYHFTAHISKTLDKRRLLHFTYHLDIDTQNCLYHFH